MKKPKIFDFKLYDYNEEYYRIYETLKNKNLDSIPSFRWIKENADLRSDDLILDAGCGSGYLLNYYLKDGAKGVGIDFSTPGLSNARKNFENIPFIRQDLRKLAFKDESFDKITCFNTIEHIKEQEEVMLELRRVLKKGGTLIIGTIMKESLAWKLYQLLITEHTHVKEFTRKEFIEFVSRYFEVVLTRKSSGVVRFNPPLSSVVHKIMKGDILIKAVKKD